MAWPDDGIIRQLHQTPNGFPQSRAVTAGEVGAAAVADKQCVARKEVSLCVDTDAARGMAGSMNDIIGYLPQLKCVLVNYQNVRPRISLFFSFESHLLDTGIRNYGTVYFTTGFTKSMEKNIICIYRTYTFPIIIAALVGCDCCTPAGSGITFIR
jgi:hypothetical protein